jgi:zinc/manganese transport system ATP-binding protein
VTSLNGEAVTTGQQLGATGRQLATTGRQLATTGRQLAGSSADMLAVDGVSVRLAGREVLRDVRFAIRPGEFVGLIGSNGAGKTTLLRVILGLQQPSAGTVRIAGADRARHAPAIGYVPQKVLLDPDMPLRARDLVGLGLDGHRLGIPLPSRGRRHLIDEMLRAVGAGPFGDERVGNLSGGE